MSVSDITKDQFMEFFRNDDLLNTLSGHDRREVFLGVLSGSGDITPQLLNELVGDYSAEDIEVIRTNDSHASK